MGPPPEPGSSAPAPAAPPPSENKEPPPPPTWSPRALWDPAGDPGPCRTAATAWRRQATSLQTLTNTLGEIGSPLPDFWKGKASTGQQQTSVDLLAELQQAVGECNQLAAALDDVADKIEEFNSSIHELWIAVGSIAAVSIVGAFFTFGASAAAGAAATAGLAARAAALANALRTTLMLARPLFTLRAANFAGLGAKWSKVIKGISFTPRLVPAGSRMTRFTGYWKGFGQTFVGGMPFTFANKALSGNNPFDPKNWRVEDLTASLLGAGMFGGMASRMTPFKGPLRAPMSSAALRTGLTEIRSLRLAGIITPQLELALNTRLIAGAMATPTTGAYARQLGGRYLAGAGRGIQLGLPAEFTGRFLVYDAELTPEEARQAGLIGVASTGTGFGLQSLWQARRGPASVLGGIARGGVVFVPATAIALVGTWTQGTQIVPQQGTPLFPWLAQAGPAPGGTTIILPEVPEPSERPR